LLPHKISKKKLNQIFVPDVEEYRKWLDRAQYDKCQTKDPAKHVPKMTYYSASTLNRVIRLVTAAIDEYYLHSEYKSPTVALKPFPVKVKEKTDKDFLVDDEVVKVLELFQKMREEPKYSLDVTYADIFTVALLTALRPGELRGLKKGDWDPETRELKIVRTGEYEDGRTKTEKSQASIIVIPKVAEIFDRRCKNIANNHDFIFQNTKGMTLSASDMRKKLRGWLKQAGIEKDLYPHSLRGSAGTFLIDAGVDIDTVSDLMRHTSNNTTVKYYVARTKKRMRNNADKVAKAYAPLNLS